MPLEQGCRVHEPGGPPSTATAREFIESSPRAELWAAPDESEAERNPIAEQIGELTCNENLVEVVAADLEQNCRDGLYRPAGRPGRQV